MKRWTVTGYPARGPERRGKGVALPAMPARVRLHLVPGGNPIETSDTELLRSLVEDLERAMEWLEAQQGALEAELMAETESGP